MLVEVVVNCGGMFAAEIGRMLDVRVPLVPMSHQYVVTDAFLDRDPSRPPLPTLRDPDLLVYFRQEVDGLVTEGDVSWTDRPIQLLGVVSDGTLTVSENATA